MLLLLHHILDEIRKHKNIYLKKTIEYVLEKIDLNYLSNAH